MCWSFRVSLATALWSYFVSFVAWKRNSSPRERWNAIFLASFCSVQTVEALFWWDIEFNHPDAPQQCTPFNRIVTSSLLIIVLFGQLIWNLIGAYAGKVKPHKLVSGLVVVLTVALVARRLFVLASRNWPCSTITPSGHLLWFDQFSPFLVICGFAVILSLPIAYMRPWRAAFVTLACVWGSCLYGATTDANGSMWCFWGNVFSVFVLLDPYIYGTTRPAAAAKAVKAN